MRHIIAVLLENESGVLSRVTGLFSARGFNIESLTVAPTNDPSLSRATLVTLGDINLMDQIVKQLHKLVDTVKVMEYTEQSHIERELLMVKVRAVTENERAELKRLADIFRAQIIDITPKSYVIELTGKGRKLDAFLKAIPEKFIIEVVRSGPTCISRGDKVMSS